MPIEESLTGTLQFGSGRGIDSIKEALYYPKDEKYVLIIKTNRGDGSVARLSVAENYLSFEGNTRTIPFAKLHLSENATKNLEKKIRSNLEIDRRD